MSDLSFGPPAVGFDPQPIDEVMPIGDKRRSPFEGYARMLTAEGGILIYYRDQIRSPVMAALRVFTWTVATGVSAWLVSGNSLSSLQSLLIFAPLTALITLIVRRRFAVSHSVEIRPDAMILDGEDVFLATDFGDNWPELQMKYGDPDQLAMFGICGNRLIELMTANRYDKYDRTPEILDADLKAAMEQLWGRREVTFPATLD
jgi:hypothetical protein